jgi:UDP-MurNAc hydroxylase
VIVKYIYSACIVIETADCRICCDPWFTQGIYEGSWYQFPRIVEPIEAIGEIDFVYISHIHPDHYDPPFLHLLLLKNPVCRVIVGGDNQEFLIAKMRRDGFSPESISRLSIGNTEIAIFANSAHDDVNVDSALVVKTGKFTVVNMNDCSFDEEQVRRIREFCGEAPTLACLPYAGAGPYPQMYDFEIEDRRYAAAELKKQQFINLFGQYLTAFRPRFAMPFAGLYYLGGSLRSRNDARGVPDAIEVKQKFGELVLILQDGIGQVDLSTGVVANPRTEVYDTNLRDEYLSQFDCITYPYTSEPHVDVAELTKLLAVSHRNAIARIRNLPSRWICFKIRELQYLCIKCDRPGVVDVRDSVDVLMEREVISIDGRLLHGLLTRKFHWNNAEIGSHFSFFRSPETYDRRVYDLLNFLHV